MIIEIMDRQPHRRGKIYRIRIYNRIIEILFVFHAIERIRRWGITEEMVAETLLSPEEVMVGHRDRYIAHRKYGNHLIRAVYEYEDELPVLITVYFPDKDRYFKGSGAYEDKIFKGS